MQSLIMLAYTFVLEISLLTTESASGHSLLKKNKEKVQLQNT